MTSNGAAITTYLSLKRADMLPRSEVMYTMYQNKTHHTNPVSANALVLDRQLANWERSWEAVALKEPSR